MKPWLLLDVDGVLVPYAAPAHRRPDGCVTLFVGDDWRAHTGTKPNRRLAGKTTRVWLRPGDGPRLLALTDVFDLMWATTWGENANAIVPPVLRLPALPVLDFGTGQGRRDGLHVKTPVIAQVDRPFVWVDDEAEAADVAYLAAHARHPHHVVVTNPARGLDDDTFDLLRRTGVRLGLAGAGHTTTT